VQAGVAKDKVETAITGDSFDGWVSKGTDDFLKTYNGTPTVLLNGTQVKDLSPATFKAAVDKAIAAG
jgi:hypothetical protein